MRIRALVAAILLLLPMVPLVPLAPLYAADEKLVFAFHYSWYSPGSWQGNQSAYQRVEPYSSREAETNRRQLAQAESAH